MFVPGRLSRANSAGTSLGDSDGSLERLLTFEMILQDEQKGLRRERQIGLQSVRQSGYSVCVPRDFETGYGE